MFDASYTVDVISKLAKPRLSGAPLLINYSVQCVSLRKFQGSQ